MAMEIYISERKEYLQYENLKPGDVFMLPNGNTAYIVADYRKYSNASLYSVNLSNGNMYDCFGGKKVVLLEAELRASPKK